MTRGPRVIVDAQLLDAEVAIEPWRVVAEDLRGLDDQRARSVEWVQQRLAGVPA